MSWQHYLRGNPDLRQFTTREAALHHWHSAGRQEGRQWAPVSEDAGSLAQKLSPYLKGRVLEVNDTSPRLCHPSRRIPLQRSMTPLPDLDLTTTLIVVNTLTTTPDLPALVQQHLRSGTVCYLVKNETTTATPLTTYDTLATTPRVWDKWSLWETFLRLQSDFPFRILDLTTAGEWLLLVLQPYPSHALTAHD